MAIGPALMALGLLWFERIPASSEAWPAVITEPSSLVPPASYLIDVLPANLLFAFGIAMLVAPLTTALMASVPVGNSGLASAHQQRLEPDRSDPGRRGDLHRRHGQLLRRRKGPGPVARRRFGPGAGAMSRRSGNQPRISRTRSRLPARQSSTDAFRLAMLIAALLCASGAR